MITASELNELYGDITAIPLDIPIIRPDNWDVFWNLWQEEKGSLGSAYDNKASNRWEGVNLTEPTEDALLEQPFSLDLADACHGMMNTIREHMPYDHIHTIKLWSNMDVVNPHRDMPLSPRGRSKDPDLVTGSYFPRAFRIMLHDDNARPTFYMASSMEKARNGTRQYVDLPSSTNSFVFNDATAFHGADYEGRQKILVVIKGSLNRNSYHDLMSRSVRRYNDAAIRLPCELEHLYFGE